MKPFVVNRHGRLVFPSNFFAELGLLGPRDARAVGSRHRARLRGQGADRHRDPRAGRVRRLPRAGYELLRDLALNLFWVNRYAMTMYDKRPMRWRDVPRTARRRLPPGADARGRTASARSRRSSARTASCRRRGTPTPRTGSSRCCSTSSGTSATTPPSCRAIKPTVAEFLERSRALTFCLPDARPRPPDLQLRGDPRRREEVPELEALHRWAMVLHNQYPWDRAAGAARGRRRAIGDDDFVVALPPAQPRRARVHPPGQGRRARRRRRGPRRPPRRAKPVDARTRRSACASTSRSCRALEALAVVQGRARLHNDDVIRNAAYSWSPMSADEISQKTGIEARRYTERGLEHISLEAAAAALEHAGRAAGGDRRGPVLLLHQHAPDPVRRHLALRPARDPPDARARSTSSRPAPGCPYGLAEAVRLLQEVERPVLLVCAEKFSDKIGSVRTVADDLRRRRVGDGRRPRRRRARRPTSRSLQTYASGPVSQVNSIIWPNPEFDNNITVYGPEVKALVQRYLDQMLGELRDAARPRRAAAARCSTSIDLVVPHQANKTMVIKLAARPGCRADQLYFNIEKMGNVSAASIPIAIDDAVREGVIDRPMRVFAPGFGAGAVGGYAVLRVDPAIVVPERASRPSRCPSRNSTRRPPRKMSERRSEGDAESSPRDRPPRPGRRLGATRCAGHAGGRGASSGRCWPARRAGRPAFLG